MKYAKGLADVGGDAIKTGIDSLKKLVGKNEQLSPCALKAGEKVGSSGLKAREKVTNGALKSSEWRLELRASRNLERQSTVQFRS